MCFAYVKKAQTAALTSSRFFYISLAMAIRSFGAKWQADAGVVRGKRLMRVFNRRDDAKAWLRKQESIKQNDRIGAFELSAPQARLAEQAFERITAAGLPDTSLLDFVDTRIRLGNRGRN